MRDPAVLLCSLLAVGATCILVRVHGHPAGQFTDQPTGQFTDEPTGQFTDEPGDRFTDEPTEQFTDETTDQPTEEPTSRPTPAPKLMPWDFDEVPEDYYPRGIPPGCGLAYVTISPLLSGQKPAPMTAARLAEITWDYENCSQPPYRAAIFELGPHVRSPFSFKDMTPVWSEILEPVRKGHIVSNYSVPRTMPGSWNKGIDNNLKSEGTFCYHFRIVLFSATNQILDSQCLKIHPTWMRLLDRSDHDNLALTELMLPGTHNSGSYSRDRGDMDSHMVRYLLTQDLSVWEQLVLGVRYFDMRVGFYPQDMGDQQNKEHPDHGQRFWVNHDMVRVQPLRPILEEVREFLLYSAGEVVVLDFHRFPVGFSSTDDSGSLPDPHQELIDLIKEVLGDIMIPNDKQHLRATLRDLITMRKHVVVSYGEKTWQAKECQHLWPPIPQQWGNQQTVDGLISYLDKQIRTMNIKHYQFWAMMAELTPTMFDILLNLQRSSLRFMANQVNRDVTAMARQGYWFSHANIIAVDYIESTDLLNVVIASNRMRATRKRQKPHFPGSADNRTIVIRKVNTV